MSLLFADNQKRETGLLYCAGELLANKHRRRSLYFEHESVRDLNLGLRHNERNYLQKPRRCGAAYCKYQPLFENARFFSIFVQRLNWADQRKRSIVVPSSSPHLTSSDGQRQIRAHRVLN